MRSGQARSGAPAHEAAESRATGVRVNGYAVREDLRPLQPAERGPGKMARFFFLARKPRGATGDARAAAAACVWVAYGSAQARAFQRACEFLDESWAVDARRLVPFSFTCSRPDILAERNYAERLPSGFLGVDGLGRALRDAEAARALTRAVRPVLVGAPEDVSARYARGVAHMDIADAVRAAHATLDARFAAGDNGIALAPAPDVPAEAPPTDRGATIIGELAPATDEDADDAPDIYALATALAELRSGARRLAVHDAEVGGARERVVRVADLEALGLTVGR